MITADEAAALYVEPPYTADEVESQIRAVAPRRDYTCFDAARLTQELQAELRKQGFTLNRSGSDIIVEWKAKAA